MVIVLPVDEDKKSVCVSFGRAPYFMKYDTETEETEVIENPAAEAQGGAGIKAAQFVVDLGADVLITIRCGQNSADVFSESSMKIYKAEGSDAKENIAAFKASKLDILTHFHAGFHGKQ